MSRTCKYVRLSLFLLIGVTPLPCQQPPVKPPKSAQPASKDPKRMPPPVIPETVGASPAPFELGLTTAGIEFPVRAPTGPARLLSAIPPRLFLRIENIISPVGGPAYNVYVNLPPGADPKKHPELCVGVTSTFGLREASRSDRGHPGDGLGAQMEVTSVLYRLKAEGKWDGKTLRVTFEPVDWNDFPSTVRIGRVSLVIG